MQVLTRQLEGEVDVKLDTFKEVRVASKNCSHAWVFTLRTKKRPLVLKDCALMNEEARQQFNLVSITVKAIKSGKSIITRSYTMLAVRYSHCSYPKQLLFTKHFYLVGPARVVYTKYPNIFVTTAGIG